MSSLQFVEFAHVQLFASYSFFDLSFPQGAAKRAYEDISQGNLPLS